jgi:hypothetical protein
MERAVKPNRFLFFAPIIPFITACALLQSIGGPVATPPAAVVTEPPMQPSPVAQPSLPPSSKPQFVAYVRDGQLLVTDVTGGVQGGTTQYTNFGANEQPFDIAWSPSGEFVAFTAPVQGEGHIFYIYAVGASTPTDLGPGSSPRWSPDSRSLAYIRGPYPDDNIWTTTIDNPSPRQLTFESNHAWGAPVFTPDGSALIVAQADRMNMGAQGNTSFVLERLALDGSGVRAPLPGAVSIDGARLPYDLRFSPDGSRLAFSTSSHLSACASIGSYQVADANGMGLHDLLSPSLKPVQQAGPERYFVGLAYDWLQSSDGLIASGIVVDCNMNGPNMGQVVGGPQMSVLRLDGSEGIVIPGMFYSQSTDRTGTLVAAAHYKDIQDLSPAIEIYSLQTGQLVLSLGSGSYPRFQP